MTASNSLHRELPSETDVLIVGAGPAGLSMARQLRKQRVRYLLVDRDDVAASWRAMPGSLRVVSPWWSNALRWRDLARYPPLAKISCAEYGNYLVKLAQVEQIDTVTSCEVNSVLRRGDGRFVVRMSLGDVVASTVVSCCGYFQQPAGPVEPPASDGSVSVIHASEFPGVDSVRSMVNSRPVLIVGRRVSAGQLMVELADAGVRVAMSSRAPLEFRRDGWIGALRDEVYFLWEELLVAFKPRIQLPSFPVMDGGRARELHSAGMVATYPPIRRIDGGIVQFEGGATLEAGLVINATGYRAGWPAISGGTFSTGEDGLPLCHDWESVDVPEFFFLGLDNRRNYRSRTLRGIRRDSAVLAAVLARRRRN